MPACSKKSQKPEENQNEKPPEVLSKLEQNIDSIIDALDKEGKIETPGQGQQTAEKSESSNTQSTKNQGSQEGQGEQSSQEQSGQGQQNQGQSAQGQQQQQMQQPNPWEQIDKTIKQMHMQWNQFQPEAVKAGVSPQISDNFSNDLNTVTNDIAVKNLMTTLNDTNNLYKYMPEFLSHYKDKSVDIKRLKYYVRDVMYKSRFDKWDEAMASALSAKNLLPNLRSQSKDETKDKLQSLEYSVYELEKVVKERQKSLTQIKGNVSLNDIKDMEKLSKESESQSQSK